MIRSYLPSFYVPSEYWYMWSSTCDSKQWDVRNVAQPRPVGKSQNPANRLPAMIWQLANPVVDGHDSWGRSLLSWYPSVGPARDEILSHLLSQLSPILSSSQHQSLWSHWHLLSSSRHQSQYRLYTQYLQFLYQCGSDRMRARCMHNLAMGSLLIGLPPLCAIYMMLFDGWKGCLARSGFHKPWMYKRRQYMVWEQVYFICRFLTHWVFIHFSRFDIYLLSSFCFREHRTFESCGLHSSSTSIWGPRPSIWHLRPNFPGLSNQPCTEWRSEHFQDGRQPRMAACQTWSSFQRQARRWTYFFQIDRG